MKKLLMIAMLAVATASFAQTKLAPPADQQPQLSVTEKTAIDLLQQKANEYATELQKIQQQAFAISNEINAEHPGWRFDMQKMQFEKVVIPPPAAAKPAPVKK